MHKENAMKWNLYNALRPVIWTLIALAVAALDPAKAAVPPTITLQGTLVNASGQPLSGTRAYCIGFYSAQTGGTLLGTAIKGTAAISATGLGDHG